MAVERLLTSAYGECFTEATRRVRHLPLVIRLLLMRLVLGMVTLEPINISKAVETKVVLHAGLRWTLAALAATSYCCSVPARRSNEISGVLGTILQR